MSYSMMEEAVESWDAFGRRCWHELEVGVVTLGLDTVAEFDVGNEYGVVEEPFVPNSVGQL